MEYLSKGQEVKKFLSECLENAIALQIFENYLKSMKFNFKCYEIFKIIIGIPA